MSVSETKATEGARQRSSDRYGIKTRINLNDLLKKRTEERKVDKKTNFIIFSGTVAVASVVVLILSL